VRLQAVNLVNTVPQELVVVCRMAHKTILTHLLLSEFVWIHTQQTQFWYKNNWKFSLRYRTFDGYFGNILILEMDQHYQRHSINKLCADSIFIYQQDNDSVIQGTGDIQTVVCGRK
jgi:hypothetical protein